MTTHELARMLLAVPELPVVKAGHEPNDDSFDEIDRVECYEAAQYDYGNGFRDDLFDPSPRTALPRRMVKVVVLR